MLRVENLSVGYGDLTALWGVSLEAHAGEILALVGSNGAGKSTLLKTISGIMKPASGEVYLGERRLSGLPQHKIIEAGVALVPEGRRLFPAMSVLENLELGAYLPRARVKINQSLAWIFDLFPILKERRKQSAGTLSGGEQQMLAIGRGLMALPKLLLLDEMSLGLAPLIVKNIYQTIKEIQQQLDMTVFMVEQNVRYALETATRAYILENGQIVGQGDTSELLKSEEIMGAYLALG